MWRPEDDYWGKPDYGIDPMFQAIIEAGERPESKMEQVLPGADPADLDDDITLAAELIRAGCDAEARALLRHSPRTSAASMRTGISPIPGSIPIPAALVHYQTGVAIGECALPHRYTGLLRWGIIDNRPFLRCLHGMGLCLWRLGRTEEAETCARLSSG